MNITIIDDNKFDIYVNNLYVNFISDSNDNDNELYDNLKKILINVRKKYALNIFGFYEVDIFYVENYAAILKFVKKLRNKLLVRIKQNKKIKSSQIARVLGMNRKMVERAK